MVGLSAPRGLLSGLFFFLLFTTLGSGVLENVLRLKSGGANLAVPIYNFALMASQNVIYATSYQARIYKVNATTLEVLSSFVIDDSNSGVTTAAGIEVDDTLNRLYVSYYTSPSAPGLKIYIVNTTGAVITSMSPSSFTKLTAASLKYNPTLRHLFAFYCHAESSWITRFDVSTDSLTNFRSATRSNSGGTVAPGLFYNSTGDSIVSWYTKEIESGYAHSMSVVNSFDSTIIPPTTAVPANGRKDIYNGAPFPATLEGPPFSGWVESGNLLYSPGPLFVTPSYSNAYIAYISSLKPSNGSAIVQFSLPPASDLLQIYPKSLITFPSELFFKTVAVDENGVSGTNIMFVGTIKGEVKKYKFSNPSNSYIVLESQYNSDDLIDPIRPALTSQLVDFTNKYIYYSSSDDSGGIWRVPFFSCGSKTTCASCVEYNDPYCGWCPFTGTCTARGVCPTSSEPSNGWLQGTASVCPSLSFSSPSDPVRVGLQPSVTVQANNIPTQGPFSGTFSCVFTREADPVPQRVTASRTVNQFSCSLPAYAGPLQDSLTETVSIALEYNDTAVVTLGFVADVITLFDCEALTTCDSCRLSAYGCGWCVSTATCTPDKAFCESSALPFSWVNSTDSCPSIGASLPKLLPAGVSTDITVSIDSVLDTTGTDYGNYTCTFSRVGSTDTVRATSVSSTNEGVSIVCPSPIYAIGDLRFGTYEIIQVSVALNNDGQDVVSLASTADTNITAFDCSTKTTCETCIPQIYTCGWDSVNNVCRANPTSPFDLTTSVGNCPKITGFSPTNVVSSVSTPLTITGTNLPDISTRKRGPFTFECVFSNGLVRPATFISPTELSCSAPPVVIEGGQAQNLTFAVRYGGLTIPSVGSFPPMTSVDCNAFGDSCLSCQAGSSLYGSVCGWCDNLAVPLLSTCVPQSLCNTTAGRTWSSSECSAPSLTDISPKQGPQAGGVNVTLAGTNLGLSASDLLFVFVGPFDLNNQCTDFGWISTRALYCVVPPLNSGAQNITAAFVGPDENPLLYVTAPVSFTYTANPTITSISPDWGTISGNTLLTITGTDFDSGSNFLVKIGDLDCPITSISPTEIVCRTVAVETPGFFNVTVKSDQTTSDPIQFRYRGNPEITFTDPLESSASSRLQVTFSGTDLDVGGAPVVTIGGLEAEVLSVDPTQVVVRMPAKNPSEVTANGVFAPFTFNYTSYAYRGPFQFKFYPNPNITDFIPKFGLLEGNQKIAILGTNLARGAVPTVNISGVPCVVTEFGDEVVKCTTGPATGAGEGVIVLSVGEATAATTEKFTYGASQGLARWVIPVIIAVSVAVLLAIIIGVVVWRRQVTKGRKKAARLFAELDKANETNMNVLSEVMEAYTEYNTRGKFVNPLFNDKPIPLTSFDVFALKTLFPDDDTLSPPNLINFSSQSKALQDLKAFKQLLMKEEFAITFFKTMEQQPDFKLTDRKYSAALFMIGLRTEIGHATNLLFCLLKDYITQKVKNGEQKTILRATSTVTEKLLTAWLAFTLHDFVSEKLSKPLFALFMAVKTQIEKGAVDSLTGSSQYTINASTILRQKVNYEHIKIRASYLDRPVVEIEVNTCDSVSQTIVSILFASGESSKLQNQVALFDGEGRQLKDIDGTNEKDGDWVKINTLAHYNVKEGSELKLMKKSGQESQALPSNNVYHLEKKAEHDPEQKIAPSEVFFTRMMTMREVIHTQVDALFNAVFNVKEAPPLPVKILFDFLDRTASELGIEDQETIHIWKNNSLALRFWVNLITNPNQLFDVTKTVPIHNSFSTIGQVLMDSCSTSESKLGPGAPASKLLYKNEVDEYKVLVNKYYQHVRAAPHIDRPHIPIPQATGERLDENSALFELRNYGKKHQTPVAESLGKEKKDDLKAQFIDATQA